MFSSRVEVAENYHLVVIKMPKIVDYFLKNGERNF